MRPESSIAHSDGSLEAAYVQHLPAIVRYLARRLGDTGAEDAAADVFTRAVRAQQHGQAITLPWLYGVATNVISEQHRRERRRLRALQRLASRDLRVYDVDGLSDATLDSELIAALRRLPPVDRETLLLVAWGELTYQQTAEALEIPIGTVRSRSARARSRLQADATDRSAVSNAARHISRTPHA